MCIDTVHLARLDLIALMVCVAGAQSVHLLTEAIRGRPPLCGLCILSAVRSAKRVAERLPPEQRPPAPPPMLGPVVEHVAALAPSGGSQVCRGARTRERSRRP